MEGQWQDYSAEEDRILKQAFENGKPGVNLRMRGQDYLFDFQKMVQRNTKTGKEREIRSVYDPDEKKVPNARPVRASERPARPEGRPTSGAGFAIPAPSAPETTCYSCRDEYPKPRQEPQYSPVQQVSAQPVQPAYQPPVQPSYYQPPVQPAYYQPPVQPAYQQPVQPVPVQPMYAQPVQPMYAQPVQPAYWEPACGPAHAQPVAVVPSYCSYGHHGPTGMQVGLAGGMAGLLGGMLLAEAFD